MVKAIENILKNPYLVVCLVIAIVVIGVTSFMGIPADLLPEFKTPAVQIVCFYPGMPPVVMERDIMSRLERWTGQSVGIARQEAKAMTGVCVVKDFFREDITMDTAMAQVTSYAMSDMFYLPPGTIPPMVMPFDPTASVPLCLVSVSSPTMSEKELYDVAYYELRNRLQSIQGVIAPAVYGGKLRRILAYVDPDELQARNLSPLDVVDALHRQNVFIPTGNAKFGDFDYQIISNAMAPHVEDLNDIPIRSEGDSMVFMRDVGTVKDSSQIQSNIVRINGRRQVYIPIYRQPGANTIMIVNSIRTQLAGILQRLREMDARAADLALEVVMDQSIYVRSSIKGLQVAAVLGALLAGIIVLIALKSLRSTLIIVLAIPLSLFIAFIGLFYTGDTVNSMTLGGLALAIGILVDQSIVVMDSITRHLKMGKSNMRAAIDGAGEVALPVGVSTLTFLVVFFPIVFLSGIPRFLFQPLAVAVIFATVGSYLVAMVVIPAYCVKFLKPSQGGREEEDLDAEPTGAFASMLSGLMRIRYLVLMATAAGIVGAIFLMTQLGTELFPPVDSNQFTIYARLPSGTRIEITEEVLKKIEARLIEELGQPDSEYPKVEKYPDSNLKILISNAGVLMDWPAAYTPNSGPMDAFLLLQLKGKKGFPNTFQIVDHLRDLFQEEFPDVEVAFDTGGMLTAALNYGLPSPINIQVKGSNLGTAHEIARRLTEVIQEVPGTVDARVVQRMDYPQIQVDVDRIKAAELGITQEEVVKNIVTSLNSSINFKPAFWIDERNGNHYFIGAQYPEDQITSIDTLKDIPITGQSTTQPTTLRNIAEIKRAAGPAVINHRNITRVIDIYTNVKTGYDVGTVAARIEKALQDDPALASVRKQTPRGVVFQVNGDYSGKGYTYEMRGEVHTMRDSFRQFAGGFLIAVILVYLVMVAQLKSFSIPFVILLTVPMAFIGVAVVLFLTGTAISIPAFMGMIMITGIVVEYSIILVDYANRLVEKGIAVEKAVRKAAQVRLRPILMTSLTTWLALLPMAVGGRGGEANAPLARAIIGGVLAATVLTLVVVPILYTLFKRDSSSGSVS